LLSGYERALLVRTPAITDEELQKSGDEFSRLTGMRLEVQSGTMSPLIAAWTAAKEATLSKPGLSAAGESL
jgi:hypothetical protein